MPFSRISLPSGEPVDHRAAVADPLDGALVACFEVAADDRFRAIHQHKSGELIVDRTYRGGPCSDDTIVLPVTTGEPRSAETKARIDRRLVENCAESTCVVPQDVLSAVVGSTFEDRSFGSGIHTAAPAGEVR
ncbi:tautomerase family protein [Rhizobium glycinendophyticum]|uniref:Tautomerase family protein n=1 Tax=Rhizobium glycinendophyticum TaxID=2589807 RepID=A0A504U5H3_9HYPH|nr:tautomerase family protein [Rhizobium glycinendophyticum]TPP09679.1 tautomerase family protein [Rhizobium glycinendophyticum]